MFTKVKDFFKKETVCCIAFLLAVVSMFFIPPSVNYFSYIDFRVLALFILPDGCGKGVFFDWRLYQTWNPAPS